MNSCFENGVYSRAVTMCICNISLQIQRFSSVLNIFFPNDVHCVFICHFKKILIGFPLNFLFLLLLLEEV